MKYFRTIKFVVTICYIVSNAFVINTAIASNMTEWLPQKVKVISKYQ